MGIKRPNANVHFPIKCTAFLLFTFPLSANALSLAVEIDDRGLQGWKYIFQPRTVKNDTVIALEFESDSLKSRIEVFSNDTIGFEVSLPSKTSKGKLPISSCKKYVTKITKLLEQIEPQDCFDINPSTSSKRFAIRTTSNEYLCKSCENLIIRKSLNPSYRKMFLQLNKLLNCFENSSIPEF